MQKIIYSISTLILLTLLSACREDGYIDTVTSSTPEIENITFAEAKINGVVLNTRYEPVEEALVQWGESTGMTDKNGAFSLNGIVSSQHASLQVRKDGYFIANKVLQTISGEDILTSVTLVERELSGVIDAESGGTIETNQGGKIEFTGGFEKMDGTRYEGEVEVYAFYLHPSRGNFQEIMPGNQMAVNLENERQVLESYGMLNVELQDPAGNVLQISQEATITSPVPDELMASAPTSIPLWYYDVEDDYWKEEGEAILDGDKYIGKVNHFTWWNCDVPRDFIFLEGTISQIRGEYWDHEVRLTINSTGTSAVTSVSEQGTFSGFVPKDEIMLLEIINICGDVVYSDLIGPFSVDVVLPEIVIDTQILNWNIFSGRLLNCDGDPVRNGYISIVYSGFTKLLFVDEDGSFSTTLPDCINSNLVYTGVDLATLKSTIASQVYFNADLNLNQIRVCEDIGGRFFMNLGGVEIIGEPAYLTNLQQSATQNLYDIKFVHPQENGTVIYTLFISVNENSGLEDWTSVAFQPSQMIVVGNPEYIFDFVLNAPGDLIIEQNSGISGSEFHFVGDVHVTNEVNDDFWLNVEFRVEAVIQ